MASNVRAQMWGLQNYSSSLCMDSCLHLLAERAGGARSWPQLQEVAREHRQLVAAMAQLQRHFEDPMAVSYSLLTFIALLGVCRASTGVPDLTNATISLCIAGYIASVCVAAELQAVAAEAFYAAVCSCPWDDWPAAARRDLNTLLLHTAHPTPVCAFCRRTGAHRRTVLQGRKKLCESPFLLGIKFS